MTASNRCSDSQLDSVEVPDDGRLGLSLRSWRRLRRVKQSHLGELLGVAQTTISRWEDGTQSPEAEQRVRLRSLLGARLDAAADSELARLVRTSPDHLHLICDLTHALLVASVARESEFGIPHSSLAGHLLWRYASPGIIEAERHLQEAGWYEPAPSAVTLRTGGNASRQVPIHDSMCVWTRMQLSDGSFARLVRTCPNQHGHSARVHQSSSQAP